MKKTLLAASLAAITATAGAQSNATISGVIDYGFVSSKETLRNNKDFEFQDRKMTGFVPNGSSASYLTFSGKEGLEGDAFAAFRLEVGVNNAEWGTFLSPRQAYVSLGNPIGDLKLGYQNSFTKTLIDSIDPTAHAPGNVAVTGYGDSYVPIAGGSDYARRYSGVSYRAASNGLFAGLGYGFFDYDRSGGDSSSKTRTYEVAAGYADPNGATFTAAYQHLDRNLNGTRAFEARERNGVILGLAEKAAAQGVVPAVDAEVDAYTLGFKYKTNYITPHLIGRRETTKYFKQDGETVNTLTGGATFHVAPTIDVYGQYTAGTGNIQAYQVGTRYYLSKRTNLYAYYGDARTPNNFLIKNNTAYGVGLRHTF